VKWHFPKAANIRWGRPNYELATPRSPDFSVLAPLQNQPLTKAKRQALDIVQAIKRFEARLDERSEVGLRMAPFAGADAIHIQSIEFIEPELLIFRGRNERDNPAELIQHVYQTNLVLIAMKRLRKTPNRIGFIYSADPTQIIEQTS